MGNDSNGCVIQPPDAETRQAAGAGQTRAELSELVNCFIWRRWEKGGCQGGEGGC